MNQLYIGFIIVLLLLSAVSYYLVTLYLSVASLLIAIGHLAGLIF